MASLRKFLVSVSKTITRNRCYDSNTPINAILSPKPIYFSKVLYTSNWLSSFIENINRNVFLQPQLVGVSDPQVADSYNEVDVDDSFGDHILLMGVPKSKVSPSRKRMKHAQHVPPKVQWYACPKCGEPKRPHRFCTKNINICAMRDDEYKVYKEKEASGREFV